MRTLIKNFKHKVKIQQDLFAICLQTQYCNDRLSNVSSLYKQEKYLGIGSGISCEQNSFNTELKINKPIYNN